MAKSLLSLEGVCKSFGPAQVLKDVSLSLKEGEILFLLGASGCGKTTLLRLIAGFETADRGTMRIGERTIFDSTRFVPAKDRHLGYVLQEGVLFPHLSVYRNIAYGLGNGKGKTPAERQRIQEVMDLTNISELADRMPHRLSGGQQQRVALARALAPNPAIMLLDEPFSALDEHLRAQIRNNMIDILRASQSAAIIVTHDRHEALSCADKIGLIQDGELVQLDTPRGIYQRPKTPAIARFISDHSVLLPAQLSHDQCCAQSSLADRIPVDIQVPAQCKSASYREGQILIRADQLVPTFQGESDPLFSARVERIEFHGLHSQVDLDAQGLLIRLNVNRGHDTLEVGQRVDLKMLGKGIFYPLT